MTSIDEVWARIRRHEGEAFHTVTGLEFTFTVPGRYLRIVREGEEINRSLSRSSFAKALPMLPAAAPHVLKGVQGPSYTWGILMDVRIRLGNW